MSEPTTKAEGIVILAGLCVMIVAYAIVSSLLCAVIGVGHDHILVWLVSFYISAACAVSVTGRLKT